VNGNQPGDYVKAWRHVHDIFVANGATNVTWVWSPNVEYSNTTPLAELYPGDQYVDWIGMDGYNWGLVQNASKWQSFSKVFGQTYHDVGQIAPTKPIMVAEMSSTELGGSKANWITDAFTTQIPQNFPNIKAFIWFNRNKETDWRIESSASSQQAFAQAIASTYYASNQFANLNTFPILPLQNSISSTPLPTPTAASTPTPRLTITVVPIVTPTPTPAYATPTLYCLGSCFTPPPSITLSSALLISPTAQPIPSLPNTPLTSQVPSVVPPIPSQPNPSSSKGGLSQILLTLILGLIQLLLGLLKSLL
jgi:hypothetical protein